MKYKKLKRLFDIILAFILILMFFPLIIILYIIIKTVSKGPFLHWSKRIGKNGNFFLMPKIRTMNTNTPQLATHLLQNRKMHLIFMGTFLRKSSLDEFPQIWSVFVGKMSFVGPRPALFNEHDLIKYRKKNGIDKLIPGITGWAQINGRDQLTLEEKVNFDLYYLKKKSFIFDIKIIFITFISIYNKKNVIH